MCLLTFSQSRSMDFHFPYKKGTGIASQLKRSSQLCVDLIARLCAYDPEERLSAKDALRHPYFKDLRYFSAPPPCCMLLKHCPPPSPPPPFRDSERRAKLASRTPSITAEVSTTKLFPNIRPHPVRQVRLIDFVKITNSNKQQQFHILIAGALRINWRTRKGVSPHAPPPEGPSSVPLFADGGCSTGLPGWDGDALCPHFATNCTCHGLFWCCWSLCEDTWDNTTSGCDRGSCES